MRMLAMAAVLLAGSGLGQRPPGVTVPPAGSSGVIRLWPDGAPGAKGAGERDVPKLYVFPAASNPTHSAVIVMPGGGYTNLVMGKEGADAARWLNEHGVTAFVLEYRLGPAYGFPAPMLDGARAVRLVRSRAAEFGVDPAKVGLWGFSAGGHLAGYMASVHDAGDPAAKDPVDRLGDRPDFVVLSYARLSMDNGIPRAGNMDGLLGLHPAQAQIDAISPVLHVTKDNSPAFIYSTTGD
jgi:acetyl esterase/lipase